MPIKKAFYNPLRKTEGDQPTPAPIAKPRGMSGFDSVDQALAFVKNRQTNLTETRQSRYTIADGVAVFRTEWPSLHKEHFGSTPTTPISPTKHVPAIKRSIVVPLRQAEKSVSEFLTFLFSNWTLIRRSWAFQKFKYYPDTPIVTWVTKYADLYLRLFHTGSVDAEPTTQVAASDGDTKQGHQKLRRVVQEAERVIADKDREIARLKSENKRLQSRPKPGITSDTAKIRKLPPVWD